MPFLHPVPGCLLCPAWSRDIARLKRSSKPCCAPCCSSQYEKASCAELLSAGPIAHRDMGKTGLLASTNTVRCLGCAAGSQQESRVIHHYTDSWCLQAESERAHAGPGKTMKISSAWSSGSGPEFIFPATIQCLQTNQSALSRHSLSQPWQGPILLSEAGRTWAGSNLASTQVVLPATSFQVHKFVLLPPGTDKAQ